MTPDTLINIANLAVTVLLGLALFVLQRRWERIKEMDEIKKDITDALRVRREYIFSILPLDADYGRHRLGSKEIWLEGHTVALLKERARRVFGDEAGEAIDRIFNYADMAPACLERSGGDFKSVQRDILWSFYVASSFMTIALHDRDGFRRIARMGKNNGDKTLEGIVNEAHVIAESL